MDIKIILAVGSAFLLGLWPLVMRLSGVHNSWASVALAVGLLSGAFISLIIYPVNPAKYSQKVIFLALAAGLMNGIGMLAFNKLLALGEISKYATISYALLPGITCFSGIIILKEPLTLRKWIGIILAIIGATLLT